MNPELTQNEALGLLRKRLEEYPEIGNLVATYQFKSDMLLLLDYFAIGLEHAPTVEHELLVVLAFYVPIDELSQNISESTGISIDLSSRLVTMMKAILIPDSILNELEAFNILWQQQELRESSSGQVAQERQTPLPEQNPNTPLTREDVLRALNARRTMGGDIEAARKVE